MPARPKTAAAAAAAVPPPVDDVPLWDTYVAEATKDLKPWRIRLPDNDLIEVTCPTSDQMEAQVQAQIRGDSLGMLVAVFGAETAPKLMKLTDKQPFVLRVKLCDDVAVHFGMSLAVLPQF